jgi:hypothetical protein
LLAERLQAPSLRSARLPPLNCYVNVKHGPPVKLRVLPANFSFLKRLSLEKPWGGASAGQERKFAQQRAAEALAAAKNRTAEAVDKLQASEFAGLFFAPKQGVALKGPTKHFKKKNNC